MVNFNSICRRCRGMLSLSKSIQLFTMLFFLLNLIAFTLSCACGQDLFSKVNMHIGTSYWRNVSDNHDYGNTMLSIGVPFAHTPWSAQTRASENKCNSPYYFFDPYWQGMRRTHWMSGSCVIDYGTGSILPSLTLDMDKALRYHALNHDNEIAKPNYYSMFLSESQIEVEVSSKNSAGIFRSHKRSSSDGNTFYYLLFLPSDSMYNQSSVEIQESRRGSGTDTVILHSPVHRWYQSQKEYAGFSSHHHFHTSRPALEYGIIHGYRAETDAGGSNVEAGARLGESDAHGPAVAYMKFDPRDGAVTVATACSFISADKAEFNMHAELQPESVLSAQPEAGGAEALFDLDGLAEAVHEVWNTQLSSIEVGPVPASANSMVQEEYRNNSIIFYTALWHSLLLPRAISDADGAYLSFTDHVRTVQYTHTRAVHTPASVVPGAIADPPTTIEFGRYYDDFSMWDIFRSQLPLLNLLLPAQYMRDMVASLVVKAQQGHWMPIFPAWNSYTGEMVGDHCGVWITDAVLKNIVSAQDPVIASKPSKAAGADVLDASAADNITHREDASTVQTEGTQSVDQFDTQHGALYFLLKNALLVPLSEYEYRQSRGRRSLDSYMQYGYIPLEDLVLASPHPRQQVSRTVEYAFDDFVAAQLLQHVRDNNPTALTAIPWEEFVPALIKSGLFDADELREIQAPVNMCNNVLSLLRARSNNYKNVIDSTGVGFVRGRHRNGSWAEPDSAFDPAVYYKWLTETNVWQYTWFVPHDVENMVHLYGGESSFARKLSTFFDQGWYNHGNEPDHHTAYLAAYVGNHGGVSNNITAAGGAWQVQQRVSHIIRSQYTASEQGLPGNEDAGQMSAWLVLSAVGIFQVCPGCGTSVEAGLDGGARGMGGEYVITTPLFDNITLHLPPRLTTGGAEEQSDATSLRILVHNRTDPAADIYIQQMYINDVYNDCAFVPHSTVVAGGTWEFYVGSQPNTTWGAQSHSCIA